MIRTLWVNTMYTYLIKREDDVLLESRSNFQVIQHIFKKSRSHALPRKTVFS